MAELLKPYEGTEPYVFVSYSHKDSEIVFSIIKKLQMEGLRIWYDKGIEWGTEWSEYIAEHICNCRCLMAFHSENSKKSRHCKSEISLAVKYEKDILPIFLEEIELSPGMELQLSPIQAIHFYQYAEEQTEEFYSRLLNSKFLKACKEQEKHMSEKISVEYEDGSEDEENSVVLLKEIKNRIKNRRHKKKEKATDHWDGIYQEVTVPIILMLDTSGSMQGERMKNLLEALQKMFKLLSGHSQETKIKNLSKLNSKKFVTYKIAIITFSSYVDFIYYNDVEKMDDLSMIIPGGVTSLGKALKTAKTVVDNPRVTLKNWQDPKVILVTDGYSTDDYQEHLNSFIADGRSAQCTRYAVGIGRDFDKKTLKKFAHMTIRAGNSSELYSAFEVIVHDIIARVIL